MLSSLKIICIQLFINIKELIQVRDLEVLKVSGTAMKILPTLKNAFLIVEDNIEKYTSNIARYSLIHCSSEMRAYYYDLLNFQIPRK